MTTGASKLQERSSTLSASETTAAEQESSEASVYNSTPSNNSK